MSDQTEKQFTKLEEFKLYCSNSPSITVELLKANQIKYDFVENSILDLLCANRKLTPEALQWLLSNYPNSIWDWHLEHILRNLDRNRQIFPMEEYIILIDYLIKIKGNLYWKFSKYNTNILHWIFANESFNAPMLNYLFEIDPKLNITHENREGETPLNIAILKSHQLLELLQVIKSHESTQTRTRFTLKYIRVEIRLKTAIYFYARDSNQSTICALVGLCGESFSLIDITYLSQDICNQFYSSKYFKWSPDQDSLIKLIPKQFQTNLRDVNSHGLKTKPAFRVQLEFE
jgi:hypothetical protein